MLCCKDVIASTRRVRGNPDSPEQRDCHVASLLAMTLEKIGFACSQQSKFNKDYYQTPRRKTDSQSLIIRRLSVLH